MRGLDVFTCWLAGFVVILYMPDDWPLIGYIAAAVGAVLVMAFVLRFVDTVARRIDGPRS